MSLTFRQKARPDSMLWISSQNYVLARVFHGGIREKLEAGTPAWRGSGGRAMASVNGSSRVGKESSRDLTECDSATQHLCSIQKASNSTTSTGKKKKTIEQTSL